MNAAYNKIKPVIVGGGIAGLMSALEIAPRPVLVINPHPLGEMCSSALAQGGLAAAVDERLDTPELHAEDTLKAGAGLCDPEAVAAITCEGPSVIASLLSRNVAFDRNESGALALSLEGAHSARRVVHAQGDSTGATIMRALIKAAQATPSISYLAASVTEVVVEDNVVRGIVVRKGWREFFLPADELVLATGGAGGLWRWTTNPPSSVGSGFALAAKAGATLADLEFMQFHPTAIDVGTQSLPLASEALRGEGAILVDDLGDRFMDDYPRKELEPRDIVARAIWQRRKAGRKVYLDARQALGKSFAARFPSVYALCREHGLDPALEPIPVCPAAHYHMGGIETDLQGRSDVDGLWACGEVACTGLHGANRLASNSLLEAAVMGARVGRDIAGRISAGTKRPASACGGRRNAMRIPGLNVSAGMRIRACMQDCVGVERNRESLRLALRTLEAPDLKKAGNMALAARMVTVAALLREESRGAHYRTDFPSPSESWEKRQKFKLRDMENILLSMDFKSGA